MYFPEGNPCPRTSGVSSHSHTGQGFHRHPRGSLGSLRHKLEPNQTCRLQIVMTQALLTDVYLRAWSWGRGEPPPNPQGLLVDSFQQEEQETFAIAVDLVLSRS